MKDILSDSPDETQIEAFRVSVESLLDETSFIARELTQSEAFQNCVNQDRKEEKGCSLETLEEFEQFSNANGIKLSSNLEQTGLAFVDEVCPEGIRVCGSFLNGIPHGFFRILNKYGDLLFFGCFIHGHLHGQSWKSLAGGGFLLNPSDDNIDFTGANIVYFYPDCQTVFVGNFEQGTMLSARASEITNTENICCGLQAPVFGSFEKHPYSLDISTESLLSKNPLWPDPYECFFVYVAESQITGAGEGLFAKISVAPGTVLAFYNGVRRPAADSDGSSEESVEDTPYKISLSRHIDMDIPPEFTSLDKYNASLAHKVCHSFSPNCDFDKYDHPRFGIVICIVSLVNISAGEELTVDYKYNLSIAPAWYKKTWAKHQKKLRGMPNWQTALTQKRRIRRTSSSLHSSQLKF